MVYEPRFYRDWVESSGLVSFRVVDHESDLMIRAQRALEHRARDLLAQLREMLENMQAGLFDQQLNQGSMGAWKMMDQLDNLMRRQQHLLDRSYQRSQGNIPQSGEGQDSGTQEDLDDSRNQESLRRALGRMMRELGDMLGAIPRPLGRAEQAMRNARKALERGLPHQAVDPQTRALDQMQQGMRAMAEQFMEQMSDQEIL